jgi:hypothetical protein
MIACGRSNQLFIPVLSAHLVPAAVSTLSIPIAVSACVTISFSIAAVVALIFVSVIYVLRLG